VGQQEQRRELDSWKEIADFLEVTPRTAQKWEEQRGLPVRRMQGPRGRVLAFADELETWKRTTKVAAKVHSRSTSSKFIRLGALTAAVLLTALGGLWWASRPRHAAAWSLEDSTLVVMDARRNVLWRKPLSGGVHSSYYASPHGRRAWFGDLDGDGTTEMLFSYTSADRHRNGSTLISYSHKGEERWRFSTTHSVSTRSERFDPPFVISDFAVAPLDGGPGLSILVNFEHSLYYPQRLALLTSDGRLRADYWHSGRLPLLAISDLDGNGTNEILLAGTNNARKQAELVVLDPNRMNGASDETGNPDYQISGLPLARELVRVLFPRSCINLQFEPRNAVSTFAVLADSITVLVAERLSTANTPLVLYHLTKDFQLRKAEFADSFRREHAALRADGQVKHQLSAEEEVAMRRITVIRSR